MTLLTLLLLAAAVGVSQQQQRPSTGPVTLPGCPDKCGEVSIPYPFGTKEGCFLPGFQITCNHSFQPPRAFFAAASNISSDSSTESDDGAHILSRYFNYSRNQENITSLDQTYTPVELTGVWVAEGKLQVHAPISYDCILDANMQQGSSRWIGINFPHLSPFFLSQESTVLLGIGREVKAQQQGGASCEAVLSEPMPVNGTCSVPAGCCQIALKPRTYSSFVSAQRGSEGRCSYAMLVERSWYNFTSSDLDGAAFLRRNDEVPVVVDFVAGNHSCPRPEQPAPKGYACKSDNSTCVQVPFDGQGYFCRCSHGYQGNPYIPTGCQDIDECERPDLFPCHGVCRNTQGGYQCTCPAGTRGNATEGCTEIFSLPAKLSVGAIGSLFVIALLVFFLLVRRVKRKMRQFFEKNGGPALEKVNNIKIYRREELKPILKSSNLIGKGCFGEVYKGVLDNQLVAVKKPINDTVAHDGQFANEVIIESQVIHKNIVRLKGCCLEVDVPMLVYEFISKGSLDDALHNSKVPLDLNVRLTIAAESAEGFAYMHSKTGKRILHGDVKPGNILLDDDYVPKISDFGISRLILRDKEHTESVIGDRSYMDPVYLQTGLLTEKSDVYSFGVVLLELVSGMKATYLDNNSLVRNFLDAHKKEEIPTELFDKAFEEPRDLGLLRSIASVAVECLNLDVDERPAMTDVAERLLILKRSRIQL
ncbi:unnamed protein product [Alopecurus aequalis]